MPRQNRVTPEGTLIAVPDRGLFWGNRGSLPDRDGRLVRYSRGRRVHSAQLSSLPDGVMDRNAALPRLIVKLSPAMNEVNLDVHLDRAW